MSLNTLYDYKLWDSLLGIESVTWEFSGDANFNNIMLADTTDGNELIRISPIMARATDEIHCRVKINGYSGNTDWFIVKEDKSMNIYLTKGYNKYSTQMYDNKVILGEIILDKDGNTIHSFTFVDEDMVLYLTQYDKILDLDFISILDIGTHWSIDYLPNTLTNVYDDYTYNSGNDYLSLPIKVIDNVNHTSSITYKNDILVNNDTYIECRLELTPTVNSVKRVLFKNTNNTYTIDNINNKINVTINDTVISILDVINDDEMYIIGIKGNGGIYLNHKLVHETNIPLNDIQSINMSQTYVNDTVSPSEFNIDYIRVYEDTLPNMKIAN